MIRLSVDVKRWVVGFSVGVILSIGEIKGDVEVVNNFQIGLDSDFLADFRPISLIEY